MAFTLTPKKDGSVLTGLSPQWNIKLSPFPMTPTSLKRRSIYDDVLYISKTELEKELKGFVTLFVSRGVIKESEFSSYLDYLQKGITNIVIDTSNIENFEYFADVARSPGHKKATSGGYKEEHHLKLRNFQLEKDRLVYEEKIMTHGKYIAELEDKISQLIEEYKGIFGEKASLENEVENLKKQLLVSEDLNAALKANNEAISKKNTSMRKELEGLMKKISGLEENTQKSVAQANEIEVMQEKIDELEEKVQYTEATKLRMETLQEQINQMEEQIDKDCKLKQQLEDRDKKIKNLEEQIKKSEDEKKKKDALQRKVSELEEQINENTDIKEKFEASLKQIALLDEQVKRDMGLRKETEYQQKKIVELEENINKLVSQQEERRQEERQKTEDQNKREQTLRKEIETLQGEVIRLKEQVKKDADLRREFLEMQTQIVELEKCMKGDAERKKQIELLQRRVFESEEQARKDAVMKKEANVLKEHIFELEEQIKRDVGLKDAVETMQKRILELEEQLDKKTKEREKQVLADIEKFQKENEKLIGKLTERESDVKMLETQKERLLKEIGGLIDSIRQENEEDKVQEGVNKLTYENMCLVKEIKEKDAVIQILRSEGEKLMQELQELRACNKEQQVQQGGLPQTDQGTKRQTPQIKIFQAQEENIKRSVSPKNQVDRMFNKTPDQERLMSRDELLHPEESCISCSGFSYYDSLKKQIEDYRTNNVRLQKKVETYYLQIEELNDVLKLTNENLDLAQNRCITLHKELENKSNLEVLVQSLLTLINNLEHKIECLVDENISLQKASQENLILITDLRNQIKEDNQKKPGTCPTLRERFDTDETQDDDVIYPKRESLEREFLRKEYEEKMRTLIDQKEIALEEERIRNKSQIDRYNGHLEVLGKKVQALVSVNEDLGRDLEVLKAEFADYKIVVAAILQDAGKSVENLRNYDVEIENLMTILFEKNPKSSDVARLREFYELMRRDIADATKLIEERRALV